MRAVPRRAYGHTCLGREGGIHDKQEFRGQDGAYGFGSVPREPRCGCSFRANRQNRKSRERLKGVSEMGKVYKYGNNVDTDVIIPARYLNTIDEKELASHCMEDIDKD